MFFRTYMTQSTTYMHMELIQRLFGFKLVQLEIDSLVSFFHQKNLRVIDRAIGLKSSIDR